MTRQVVSSKLLLIDNPVKAAPAYGIKWLVWANNNQIEGPKDVNNVVQPDATSAWILCRDEKPLYSTTDVTTYRMKTVDPIVFAGEDAKTPLPYKLNEAGLDVVTQSVEPGTSIVVNFLCWPWITAWANGEKLTVTPDKWQRIMVRLPSAAPQLLIRYSPPWKTSCSIALGLLALGLGSGFFAARINKAGAKETQNNAEENNVEENNKGREA
jgi:hypothetical protein